MWLKKEEELKNSTMFWCYNVKKRRRRRRRRFYLSLFFFGLGMNDPSAGSPTETLLRLFLPLNVKAYTTSPVGQETVSRIGDHDSGAFTVTFNR